jgi:hypothetical protein
VGNSPSGFDSRRDPPIGVLPPKNQEAYEDLGLQIAEQTFHVRNDGRYGILLWSGTAQRFYSWRPEIAGKLVDKSGFIHYASAKLMKTLGVLSLVRQSKRVRQLLNSWR